MRTSKSPKRVLIEALRVGEGSLPAYAHRFSPKKFTLPQLFACLVLKDFYNLTYRGVVGLLADGDSLAAAIGLEQIPHWTTLQKAAVDKHDKTAEEAAKDELDSLLMFQSDMASFVRLYTYLSQIFDYGNTAIEKRAIFFRQVLRLLEFGRERQGIDLSKVVLTHHTLRNRGKQSMQLLDGENPKLEPLNDVGGGALQETEKALLDDIIRKVNDLFEGELTEQDKLVYVNNVIKGKLLESETLRQQAASNTKEQFANSPDLKAAMMDAIIDALEAHTTMSKQALDSESVREGLKEVLMGPARLYESLKERQAG